MISIFKERLRQKYRTLNWPYVEPVLSPHYCGKPELTDTECGNCDACLNACPVNALFRQIPGHTPCLDLGKCIFCGECAKNCPKNAFVFTNDYRMAAFSRKSLIICPDVSDNQVLPAKNPFRKIFKKSLKLRQVSAGGCNACEADCNVLGTPVYDLGRFGIEFTASPRHADGLVLTGPVSLNMLPAFVDTWQAMPAPKFLIAAGACSISGGLFCNGEKLLNGIDDIAEFSADIYIPGCPPNPWTILDGILKLFHS